MDNTTKANINLFAVLSNLPVLCVMDEQAQKLIQQVSLTMQLVIRGAGAVHLVFEKGSCTFFMGKAERCDIALHFKSAEHLNKMFDGKALPGIRKGFTKLKFLTETFTKLTDRLAYFLKPTEGSLNNPEYHKINTYLTFHTAFYAVAQIANHDNLGKKIASSVPAGVINIIVNDGPAIHITVDEAHVFTAHEGKHERPRAIMQFMSLQNAGAILNGTSDIYTEIGKRTFSISGYIPMMDDASRLLALVPSYLKQEAEHATV